MKITKITAFIFTLVLSVSVYGQQTKSLVGTSAPLLSFEKMINFAKPTATSSEIKPKILIVDFWATWCAPCIASFPHLEAIQKKYANKLQIITVTDETEERISQFLTRKSLSLPIAFDTEAKLATAFPYQTLPHTVIIDANNTIRAVTTSASITDEVIDKILANQSIALEEKKEDFKFDASKPLSSRNDSIYQTTLLPYQEGFPEGLVINYNAGTSVYANRRILVTNAKLQALYETAYEFPVSVRTIIEASDKTAFEWSKQTAYSYELVVPASLGSQRFSIMRRQLAEVFPYRAAIEKRQADVKVLRRIANQPFVVESSKGGKSRSLSSGEGLEMTNFSFAKVSLFLQSTFNSIVIDETGITGNYDLKIPYFNEDPDRIYLELKNLGLELVNEKRETEMLVIYDGK